MSYKIVDGELVAETDKNYISLSSSKRELFDALRDQVNRAEAAEARAAMLQEALGPNARILNQRRDEQIKQLTAERDTFSAENDAVHRAINAMCGTNTSTVEAVQHVIEQRDELARKLEQAQRACAYWLAEGRFLVANSPQHQAAVDMLRTVSNQAMTP